MHPKILIIATTPYSTSDSSRTLDAYFHYWEKDRVAQIFSRNWIPNKGHCGEMYQITDASLLKKWLHKPVEVGKIYTYDEMRNEDGNEVMEDSSAVGLSYKIGSKHSPSVEILRGLLWRKKFWCTPKFIDWLDSFKPECIVYNFSNHLFTQQIALFVANRYQIPIVAIIGDNYYFDESKSKSPAYKLFRNRFRKLTEKVLSSNSSAVYCSDKIKHLYNSYFHMHGETVYFSSSLKRREFRPIDTKHPKVVYFGSIRLGRNLALLDIAKELTGLNPDYRLEVYSNESDEGICGVLKAAPNVIYGGSIPYSQVEQKTAECDIFVIAEGFRDEDINLTKYSLSTKASDGLASGAAILTYGPEDAGVVGYMKETGASMVCTDPKNLKESLRELICSEELQKNFYQKAIEVTQAHHTIESSTATFEKVVERAVREFNSKRNNE